MIINPEFPLVDVCKAVHSKIDLEWRVRGLPIRDIGKPCRSDLWHTFMWSSHLQRSDHEHLQVQMEWRSKHTMLEYLLAAGYRVNSATNGEKIHVKALGGHLDGFIDGIINNFPLVPKGDRCIWQHETVPKAQVDHAKYIVHDLGEEATRLALSKWDPVIYAEAQLMMLILNTKHHWLTVSSPGCVDITAVYTTLDQGFAEALAAKAETIISTQMPPIEYKEKDPHALSLKHHKFIYGTEAPTPNWRNSYFAYPCFETGEWIDDYHKAKIPIEVQHEVPTHHLWNPDFINWAKLVTIENAEKPRWALYQLDDGTKFYNMQAGMEGPGGFNSTELAHLNPDLVRDPNIAELRKSFKAKVVK